MKKIPPVLIEILTFVVYALLCACTLLTSLCCTESSAFADGLWDDFRSSHSPFLRLATGEGKDIELRYLFEPDTDSKRDSESELVLHELRLAAELPIPLSRDLFLRLAPVYSARYYDFEGIEILGVEVESEVLYDVQLGLGFGKFISDDLLFTAMFRPGLITDFDESLNKDQLKYFGETVFVYELNPNLELLAGIVTNERFDHVKVYPVAGLRYQSSDQRLHLKLTPPIEARLGYYILEYLQPYISFKLTGNEYRVQSASGQSFDVQVQDQRLGAGVLYWFSENTNASLELGANLESKFEFEIAGSDLGDKNSDTSAYGFISLGYTL